MHSKTLPVWSFVSKSTSKHDCLNSIFYSGGIVHKTIYVLIEVSTIEKKA